MKEFPVPARRTAIKKITGASALATLSTGWMKPAIDTVVLPAHASTTTPECFPINVEVIDWSDAGQSGGNGELTIEISSTAPDPFNQVSVSASVDNGTLVGDTSGNVYATTTVIFGWFGPAIPGTPVPLDPTELTVDWTCADGQTGTDTFDLVAMASAAIENENAFAEPEPEPEAAAEPEIANS